MLRDRYQIVSLRYWIMPTLLSQPAVSMMARKKPVEPSPITSARLQDVSVETIAAEMKEIQGFFSELQAVLEEAGTLGNESIEIDGATKFSRAKDLIDEFVGKAVNGLRKARRLRRSGTEPG